MSGGNGNKEAGIKGVLGFIAGRPLTGEDELVIKEGAHPGMGWADFYALMNQMVLGGFLKISRRVVEGNRYAVFYRLTKIGWETLREGNNQPN